MSKDFPETLPYWAPRDPDGTKASLAAAVDAAIASPLIETHELVHGQLEAIVQITDGYARAISSTISGQSDMSDERRAELGDTRKAFQRVATLARNQLARLAEFRQADLTNPG